MGWTHPRREIVNVIRYVLRTGCSVYGSAQRGGSEALIHRRETAAVVRRRTRGRGTGRRRPNVGEIDDAECDGHARGMLTACGRALGAIFSADCRRRPSGAQPGAVGPESWVMWWRGQTPRAWSRREWEGAQPRQSSAELGLPGPALGRMQGGRRAVRVRRPAKEKKRRLRVLVVATGLPRPMRVVQRARLWAMTWTASPAGLAGGEVVEPHAVLESLRRT